MNDTIKQLAVMAKIQMVSEPRLQEFAELVAKECIWALQLGIVRNGHSTPENLRTMQHITDIAEKFGIKLPTDYMGIVK